MRPGTKTAFKENDEASLIKRFERYREILRNSEFFTRCVAALKPCTIEHIYCLALGSPTESIPSLYQLAFLDLIREKFGITSREISLFDPIFSEDDRKLLEECLGFTIDSDNELDSSNTLFFLPHATLELTEEAVSRWQPKYFLGNNIASHTGKLSKGKLHLSYRQLSLLRNLIEDSPPQENGFITVTSRRRRKIKNTEMNSAIEYNYKETYFRRALITPLAEINTLWGNSFSDLALHFILHE